jgi:hypothetical protein
MRITLQADAATARNSLESVEVSLHRSVPNLLQLRYTALGEMSGIVVPPPAPPLRTDGLWENTCFELFLRAGGRDSYLELNFAPSGQWAAYAFTTYRAGMAEAALPEPPRIRTDLTGNRLQVDVALHLPLDERAYDINATAITLGRDGERRFWAASHPPGEPDFHHPDCFIHQLPAAPRA